MPIAVVFSLAYLSIAFENLTIQLCRPAMLKIIFRIVIFVPRSDSSGENALTCSFDRAFSYTSHNNYLAYWIRA